LQLALDGIIKGDRELARMYLDTLQANIPEATVPVSNRELYMQISQLYSEVGDTAEVARRLDEFPNRFRVRQQDQVRLAAMYGQGLGDWDRAEQMLNEVYRRNPTDGELVGNIIALYRSAGHDDKVIPILEEWLIKYPNDNSAKQLYEALTAK
ncbi:MAG: tetratricopeptide repeat protein, partial [Candidatus Marinimicrobia bacterium]|nr:tetratricopeptide repeat protein [Candidatus Neomarinimicrobiota bacterium]